MSLAQAAIQGRMMTAMPVTFLRTIDKIDHLLADGETPIPVLHAVIASDPMLTALILGRANAARPEPVMQLSMAMRLLGLGSVHGLVREARAVAGTQRQALASCWGLANATATFTRIIGGRARAVLPPRLDDESLHALGLLHDLGTAMAILHFTNEYARAGLRVVDEPRPFAELLKEELGSDACGIGRLLAVEWNLPPVIAAVIEHHPAGVQSPVHVECVALVHLARGLARALGFGASGDLYLEPIDEGCLSRLRIAPVEIEQILKQFYLETEENELYEGALVL